MSFPERLRKLRKSANLSQQQLGEAMNVTKVSISGYETGNRRPDTDTLQRLADYFHVSTDYLLGRSTIMEYHASYASTEPLQEITEDDIAVLQQLQTYPVMYQKLKKEPIKQIEQLYRMWEFIEKEKQK